MTLKEWADRWHLPAAALNELAAMSVKQAPEPAAHAASETRVQSEVRLEAAKLGIYLWRNNIGAGKLAEGGRFIRWGLANDSTQLNTCLKSGDLIGIHKRLITAADVGTHIGQFVSREIKRANWKYSGSLEDFAQLQWVALIRAQGGDAAITNGRGSFDGAVGIK